MIDFTGTLALIGVLVAIVNIVVQVIKPLTYDRMPTQLLAVLVSLALTVTGGIAYLQIANLPVLWCTIAALVVLGILVAYAAMYGYDKIVEVVAGIKQLNNKFGGSL